MLNQPLPQCRDASWNPTCANWLANPARALSSPSSRGFVTNCANSSSNRPMWFASPVCEAASSNWLGPAAGPVVVKNSTTRLSSISASAWPPSGASGIARWWSCNDWRTRDSNPPTGRRNAASTEQSMSKTIFEKIIACEVPAEIIYEDELAVAFRDVNPKAPVHVLIVPRKPIPRIADSAPENQLV